MDQALLNSLILLGILLFVILTAAAYATFAERKVSAWIQQRIGPNRVGPWGLLQPAADALKLILKENITPASADKFFHYFAPLISVTVALSTFAVIPFSHDVLVADVNIGILFILGLTSISVYGITLAGWSSNSKYSLLGGLRASAQMISYELSMGLSIVSCVLLANAFGDGEYLKLSSIVQAQQNGVWFILLNPIAFFIFFTCALAECNRAPFDLVEAEQELVGGYHTEYSSMRFGLFYLAEYVNMIVSSMVISVLFFGGYDVPFVDLSAMDSLTANILEIGSFATKTAFFLFVFIWVRWSLPRFKYNQLMDIGWKSFLPVSIINLILVAVGIFIYLSMQA